MPLAIPTPPSPLYLLPCRRFVRAAQARWESSPLPPNRRPPTGSIIERSYTAMKDYTADDWSQEVWVLSMQTIYRVLQRLAAWELAWEANQRGGLDSGPPSTIHPPTIMQAT